MPKERKKVLCMDAQRHAEYYGMQRTFDELYAKSKAGETFIGLMELVLSPDNIMLAYRNIKTNTGSYTAGTDKQNIGDIGRLPPAEVIGKVRKIVTGSEHGYRPKPVRRKDIPKPNGKTRPLGIPCIWDRLVQQCIKQILEPICEAKFSNNSYGFRPNRSVEHAISRTYSLLQRAHLHYVLEFDIKGFFDNVNHSKLIKQLWTLGIQDKQLEYLGHTVNFKTRKHFKDKKSHYVPEDEWTIFEDTHEAIIDQETFDLAQKVRSKVRRYPDGWGEVAPLTGLMYCADCGGKMYVHRTNNGKRISQYTCSQYTKVPCGTFCKTQHRINESVVLELISDLLKAIAEYAQHDRVEFVRVVQEAQDSHFASDVKKKRNRLTAAQNRLNELEVLLCKIYEDNILGKLPDTRYATLDAQYGKEQAELKSEVKALEEFLESHEKNKKSAERFISLIEKYENFDNLTIAMLNEFIDKILVHERDRKGSIQTTQEIEIYFNFVGKFVPPHFMEEELTPEELEEIRKREERKDRLHQNYLKRKASGAQKRYEDKIKAKKKAEMDAKNNALRAEDVAKGVFVPISNMPKLEPKIAPQKGA